MVSTKEFVGELHVRRVQKGDFARAHGISAQDLGIALREAVMLPDSYMATLDRIAPVDGDAGREAGGPEDGQGDPSPGLSPQAGRGADVEPAGERVA